MDYIPLDLAFYAACCAIYSLNESIRCIPYCYSD